MPFDKLQNYPYFISTSSLRHNYIFVLNNLEPSMILLETISWASELQFMNYKTVCAPIASSWWWDNIIFNTSHWFDIMKPQLHNRAINAPIIEMDYSEVRA